MWCKLLGVGGCFAWKLKFTQGQIAWEQCSSHFHLAILLYNVASVRRSYAHAINTKLGGPTHN